MRTPPTPIRAAVVLLLIACGEPSPRQAKPPVPPAETVSRGLALLEHTADSLPEFALSNLRCTSCHLDRGTRTGAASLIGAVARYPMFVARAGVVASIEDRVNYCFTRSLAGSALPTGSRDMADIVAYLASLSRSGNTSRVLAGMPAMPAMTGDSSRGDPIFNAGCARCHGGDGAGTAVAPAVWGARSYSIGASMARVERAASFIRHNMPFDQPGTLTDQQAYDVAAFINSHPRPDLQGKQGDWPNGGAPADVPYATPGRAPHHAPPVLARPQRSTSSTSRAAAADVPSGAVTVTVSR